MAAPKRKRVRKDECKVDRISLLPDEVLVSILSFLDLKKATATSILARRWRYLHSWTRKLHFDGADLLCDLEFDRHRTIHLVDERFRNYVKWVEGVMRKHKSSTIEELGVLFILDCPDSQNINKWLRFAISRRVEKLELNLTSAFRLRLHYKFPYHLVGSDEFKFLKELSVNCVNMNGEFVKEVVRNCRLLQNLSVSHRGGMSVEIIESSPAFKSLDIYWCHHLRSLVIRDSNIVTLKVHTFLRIERVVLENVPFLDEFWCQPKFTEQSIASMENIRVMFSSVFPQLRVLKIYTISWKDLKEEDWRNFCSGVEFSNLKQLVVVKCANWNRIVDVIHLIKASPQLEIFELIMDKQYEVCSRRRIKTAMATVKSRAQSTCRKIPKKYPCLKTVIIVGYQSLLPQFEMVMHLVANGAALQNIIVDPREVYLPRYPSYKFWDFFPKKEISHEIIEGVLALKNFIPPRINLHIR